MSGYVLTLFADLPPDAARPFTPKAHCPLLSQQWVMCTTQAKQNACRTNAMPR